MAQPVVSYPGAKWRFYKWMVDYFPLDMKTYIEPFFGGGSVGLSVADDPRFTQLERLVVGDLYTEMYSLWQGIKEDPAAIEEIATKWFTEKCPTHEVMRANNASRVDLAKFLEDENWINSELIPDDQKSIIKQKIEIYNKGIAEAEAFWKWTQSVDTNSMTTLERAARMILVNKVSFSGMGDSGSLSKDQFFDFTLDKLQSIYPANKLLQRFEIYNVSFEDTMKHAYADPKYSFVFLDPPYLAQEGSGLYGRGGSTHHGFPHQKFAEETMKLPCKWFVTYDDSVGVRKLFQGKTYFGDECKFVPFTIPGGYTMSGNNREDALAGEELFIMGGYGNSLEEETMDNFDF